jgi:hypothetical protein
MLFLPEKKKQNATGEIYIFLRITVDSNFVDSVQKENVSQKLECKTGRAEGKTDYAKSITVISIRFSKKYLKRKRRLIEVDEEVTPS